MKDDEELKNFFSDLFEVSLFRDNDENIFCFVKNVLMT